jgi:hypothetical protein
LQILKVDERFDSRRLPHLSPLFSIHYWHVK